ncbi:MAG: hypothetical protein HY289_10105 [Planctomycetes bacterium]|nr:hypothetical protein [Planctomycetota bacterium]
MTKKNNLKRYAAQAVEGQIIKVEFDFSSAIGDVPLEQWTRGPAIPVLGRVPATNGKRRPKGRKKRA